MKFCSSAGNCFAVFAAIVANFGSPNLVAIQESETERPAILAPVIRDLQASADVFRSARDAIAPALVAIESFGGVGTIPGVIGGIRRQGEGNTTGVVISADGWIVTSTFNFVQLPPLITVVTSDGIQHVARLRGQDNTRKICLLKIDDVEGSTVAAQSDVKDVFVGQTVLAVGVGYGDTTPSISAGIVSALKRISGRAVQTDAKISPACYGGPLVDIEGRMIGVCVPMNPQSSATTAGVEWYDSGIGFAVPLADITEVIQRLKNDEIINPAFLGVAVKKNPGTDGVMVAEVIPDSPAAEAGVVAGAIVTAWNGKESDSPSVFRQLMAAHAAGDQVTLTIRMPGAEVTREMEIKLGFPPEFKKPVRGPGL